MCGAVRATPGGKVDKIVAAGGVGKAFEYLDVVEVYDIATNTWETGECFFQNFMAWRADIFLISLFFFETFS